MVSFGQTTSSKFSFYKMAAKVTTYKAAEEFTFQAGEDIAVIHLEEAVSYSGTNVGTFLIKQLSLVSRVR